MTNTNRQHLETAKAILLAIALAASAIGYTRSWDLLTIVGMGVLGLTLALIGIDNALSNESGFVSTLLSRNERFAQISDFWRGITLLLLGLVILFLTVQYARGGEAQIMRSVFDPSSPFVLLPGMLLFLQGLIIMLDHRGDDAYPWLSKLVAAVKWIVGAVVMLLGVGLLGVGLMAMVAPDYLQELWTYLETLLLTAL
ncbi:MAG: hypothetical protein J5I90_17805 [Caldilineales bacterium]|nr:hypothetical protein [Caldilineales bacterium]